MPNEIKVTVAAKDTGLDKTVKDAKRAGQQIADGLDKGFRDAEKSSERTRKATEDDLDKTKKKAKETGDSIATSFTEAFSQLGGEAGGAMGDLFGEFEHGLSGLKAGALGAGVLVGGALLSGFNDAFAEDSVGHMIAAQTGASGTEAGRLGTVAGEVFANNFGDSIQEVGEAMSAVFNNKLIDESASDAAIQHITESAMTASQAVGEEVNEIARAARQLLVNDMAGSVDEAMDMIVHASQKGLNVNGDLIDTIVEYSGQFDRLGLKGADAMGLISQAMEGGARDTDYAADALKEFAIRAQDGSATTVRGFETIGLNAEQMGQRIAAGGDSARQALRETLNGLQVMQDPIARNTAAVDLFGAKAEDLGEALYSMDLDNAADEFGDYSDAVEKTAAQLSDAVPATEKFARGFQNAKSDVAEFLVELGDWGSEIDNVNQKFVELAGAQQDFLSSGSASALDELKKKYPELAEGIDKWIKENRGAVEAHNEGAEAAHEYASSLQQIISASQEMASGILDLSGAQIGYQESIRGANEALQENGKNLDITTEKGGDNKKALDDIADSAWKVVAGMKESSATTEDVRSFMEGARGAFVQMAIDMGMDAVAANALADKLGLVPGNYVATVAVNGFEEAMARADALENKIRTMTSNKVINLRVNTSGSGMGGHMLAGLASGGVASAAELGSIYSSGIPFAAAGGAQGMATVIKDEQGPEITRMPNGSMVIPAGQSQAMMQGMMGGTPRVELVIRSGGAPIEDLLTEVLRRACQAATGGNVQAFLGSGS